MTANPTAPLIEQIEANIISFREPLTTISGADCVASDQMVRLLTPIPSRTANFVMRTRLPDDEVERLVAETIARFRAAGNPWTWIVFPTAQPDRLGRVLA